MAGNAPQSTNRAEPSATKDHASAVTPSLVREVTEKVYALWLRDLRLDQERARRGQIGNMTRGGMGYGR